MICKNCGEEIANNSNYCEFCGEKQINNTRGKWWLSFLVLGLFSLVGVAFLLLSKPAIRLEPDHHPFQPETTISGINNSTQEQSVSPTEHGPSLAPSTIRAEETGSIEIKTVPSGASIWLDGKDTKKIAPCILSNIVIGEHSIKLVLGGYEDYYDVIVVTTEEQDSFSQLLVHMKKEKVYIGSENGHEWVDLGVSVKWATCNIGALSPSGYGNYYAFGEISTKNDYDWNTLLYCTDTTGDMFSKYNTNPQYGEVDNKTRLDLTDDAARANWGGKWRIPTESEFREMLAGCHWQWTTEEGIAGYKFISAKNGCSIFIPAAGLMSETSVKDIGTSGFYWTASVHEGRPYYGYSCSFDSSGVFTGDVFRYYGLTIRPVIN